MSPKTTKAPAPSRHPMNMRPRNRATQPPQSTAPSVSSEGPPTPPQPPSSPDIHPPPNAPAAPVMQQLYGLHDPLPGPPESKFAAPRRLEAFGQRDDAGRDDDCGKPSEPAQTTQRGVSNARNVQRSRKDIKGKGRQREQSQESEQHTDFSTQRSPSYDRDADNAMDTDEDSAPRTFQTPTRQHVLPEVPAAPLRPSHRPRPRGSSRPQLGVAGSSRYPSMFSIDEEDENTGDAISSFHISPTRQEANRSFLHLSDPNLRCSSVDSELEVADMLYPPPMEMDSVVERQVTPRVSQLPQQQAQPIPPNYPQNAALRRGPTLPNL